MYQLTKTMFANWPIVFFLCSSYVRAEIDTAVEAQVIHFCDNQFSDDERTLFVLVNIFRKKRFF